MVYNVAGILRLQFTVIFIIIIIIIIIVPYYCYYSLPLFLFRLVCISIVARMLVSYIRAAFVINHALLSQHENK